ncbi:MAG TPA: glycosyl hydrolase family 65 protein [Syntrophales bacterium]|nr:glycosyl hydrolase family 65 protein [Syntrophales bacterium]
MGERTTEIEMAAVGGWMYRLIVESLLGLTLTVDRLNFAPHLPVDWEGFTVHYRYRETVYHIAFCARRQAMAQRM